MESTSTNTSKMLGFFDKAREPSPMICRKKKRRRKLRNEQSNLPYVKKIMCILILYGPYRTKEAMKGRSKERKFISLTHRCSSRGSRRGDRNRRGWYWLLMRPLSSLARSLSHFYPVFMHLSIGYRSLPLLFVILSHHRSTTWNPVLL